MSRTRRKGRHTAYTHPVLGNGEDFPDQTFTAKYHMRKTEAGWDLTCSIHCGNPHIAQLVEEGRALYVLDFDCPSVPFSRTPIESDRASFVAAIPRESVCGEVSILAAVIATRNIPDYDPPGRNAAFKGTREILKNEFLAVDAAGRQNFGVNGGLRCLIRIRRAKDSRQTLAQFHGDDTFFWITLPQKDYDNWSRVKKNDPELDRNLLSPTFLQPALMEALRTMDEHPNADWSRSLGGIMEAKKLDPLNDPPSKTVQILLDTPIARACSEASTPKETEE